MPIQILSGKGGVGKSSVTAQLALSLSLAGHSIGILDVDLTGPSIPRLFGLEYAKIKQAPGGWLPVEVHAAQTLEAIPVQQASANGINGEAVDLVNEAAASQAAPTPLLNDGTAKGIGSLHIMSLGFLLPNRSSAVVWRGPKKTAMVRQFLTDVLWPPVDFLLVDTPPGTSDEHISLAEQLLKMASPASNSGSNGPSDGVNGKPHLAGAVVVTTPQAVATSDVRKELNFCAKVGIKVLGVMENMSGYVCECCGVSTSLFGKGGGEVMSKDFGVQFLGGVPVDGQWGVLVEEGKRPKYGGVQQDENENEENETRETGGTIADGEKEEGLLVDKYRSCSLSGLFEAIARGVVQTIEPGESGTTTAMENGRS